MSPAVSPAGADQAPLRLRGKDEPVAFSHASACRLVGLSPSDFRLWEQRLRAEAGLVLGETLTVRDLLALGVLSSTVAHLRQGADAFAVGLAEVFRTLATQSDVGHLDGSALLVGRDFARLTWVRGDHLSCPGDDFVIVALGPILAAFRDQVFA